MAHATVLELLKQKAESIKADAAARADRSQMTDLYEEDRRGRENAHMWGDDEPTIVVIHSHPYVWNKRDDGGRRVALVKRS